jgi:hypothetical protein
VGRGGMEGGRERKEKRKRQKEGSRFRFTIYLLGEGLQEAFDHPKFLLCKKFIH